MHHLKLWRIEKPARLQTARGCEVAPLLATESNVEPCCRRAKRSVRRSDTARWSGLPQARTCGYLYYQARFVAKFCRRRSGNHFQRLNRFHRNLIREDLALLIRDRLAIHGKRIFCVIPKSVEESVGIGYYSRRRQGHQRTDRRRRTFQRYLFK